jgi:hypothetical protein
MLQHTMEHRGPCPLPVPLPFPTITGVWKWRIIGGGEDRRHINTQYIIVYAQNYVGCGVNVNNLSRHCCVELRYVCLIRMKMTRGAMKVGGTKRGHASGTQGIACPGPDILNSTLPRRNTYTYIYIYIYTYYIYIYICIFIYIYIYIYIYIERYLTAKFYRLIYMFTISVPLF